MWLSCSASSSKQHIQSVVAVVSIKLHTKTYRTPLNLKIEFSVQNQVILQRQKRNPDDPPVTGGCAEDQRLAQISHMQELAKWARVELTSQVPRRC
jgi:hypothetical protein